MSGLVLSTSSADFPSDFLYANAARLLEYFNQNVSPERRVRGLHSLGTSNFPKVNFGVIRKSGVYTKFVMEVALAGYNPDDVELEIDKKNRVISVGCSPTKPTAYAVDAEEEDDEEEYIEIGHEIKQSSFKRSFTAPDRADLDNITHKYEDGILRLEIPIVDSAPHITKLKLK